TIEIQRLNLGPRKHVANDVIGGDIGCGVDRKLLGHTEQARPSGELLLQDLQLLNRIRGHPRTVSRDARRLDQYLGDCAVYRWQEKRDRAAGDSHCHKSRKKIVQPLQENRKIEADVLAVHGTELTRCDIGLAVPPAGSLALPEGGSITRCANALVA